MSAPGHDPSIENEPHLRHGGFAPDPTEDPARRLIEDAEWMQTDDDRVEHSVWDEPGLSPELAGVSPDGLTYADWLERRIAETTPARSWTLAALIALAAGPWAILGAFIGGEGGATGVIMITIVGPVLEELMKVAACLWAVEKRPFLFQSRAQIALCVLFGSFVFAAVENLLYLNVYVPDPSDLLIQWRWTICVALHMGCSFIAGLGLMRTWQSAVSTRTRPQLSAGALYMVTAIVIHGVYNAFAVVLSVMDFQF